MYIAEHELLFLEWNTLQNSKLSLDPHKLLIGSNKTACWKCSKCGHEWEAQIAKRGIRGQGCPICGKEKARMLNLLAKQGSLADNYPELKIEWDTEKNEKKPSEVLSGSNEKAFWKCKICGYSWEAMIAKRAIRGQGCPICGKEKGKAAQKEKLKMRIAKEGSVGSLYPDLVKEWDFDKNTSSPYDYLPQSNASVYWVCSTCGYRWKGQISNRTKGAGCAVCGRKRGKETLLNNLIAKKGSLADLNPELANEWDNIKNGELTPAKVMLYTNKAVWWLCSACGYSWKSSVANRAIGRGCPRCALIQHGISTAKPIVGVNDLLSQAPELAKEIHPTKNNGLLASNITRSSNKKIWWLGKCGHEWKATVGSRFFGRGCPLCLKEFKISYPEKAIFFYLNKYLLELDIIENYKPQWLQGKELDIFIPSLCFGIEYDGANWHHNTNSDIEKNKICKQKGVDLLRIREKGAPEINYQNTFFVTPEKDEELMSAIEFVFGYLKRKYGISTEYTIDLLNDRVSIYELMELNQKNNSLQSLYPEIAKEWHPTKNGKITPEYVNAHTHRKFWWLCPLGHEYDMVVKHRIEKVARCPFCSSHRILPGFNDLQTKRPEIAKMWDYNLNGGLKPSEVMEFSNIKVWWKCGKGHSYQRLISAQTSKTSECPICKMQVLSPGVNDLVTLYPAIANEWDYSSNGDAKPEAYTPISGKRFNWKCQTCGWTWNISIKSRCILGHGCPKCAGKKRWETRQNKLGDLVVK